MAYAAIYFSPHGLVDRIKTKPLDTGIDNCVILINRNAGTPDRSIHVNIRQYDDIRGIVIAGVSRNLAPSRIYVRYNQPS